jgi:hypothetical protein
MIATLDHNCVIDIENGGERALPLRTLIAAHRGGRAMVRLVAVGASERILGGGTIANYGDFARTEDLDRDFLAGVLS